jgi:hypothetical protein
VWISEETSINQLSPSIGKDDYSRPGGARERTRSSLLRSTEDIIMQFTRQRVVAFVFAVGITVTATGLWAAVNFHNVSCTSDPNTFAVSCTGVISGLGNGTYDLFVTATGVATTTCTNKGGNEAPGQNPANVTSAGAVPITINSDTNGNYDFTVNGAPPPQPTARQAGCPGNNWTATIVSVDYSTATLTVKLGNRTVASGTFPVQ